MEGMLPITAGAMLYPLGVIHDLHFVVEDDAVEGREPRDSGANHGLGPAVDPGWAVRPEH